jgi:hypothetical protein
MPLVQGVELGAVYRGSGEEAYHAAHLCEPLASGPAGPTVVACHHLASGKWYYLPLADFLAQMRHGSQPAPVAAEG